MDNKPELWRDKFPELLPDGHKYDRGHTVVISGPASQTGAARLAAGAALRAGSGLVTLYSPPSAVLVNAAHLTAVMIKSIGSLEALNQALADRRITCAVAGPALGIGEKTCLFVEEILSSGKNVVLDADALTSFANMPDRLFEAIKKCAASVIVTPHMGEFATLFGDQQFGDGDQRINSAVCAAHESGAIVVLKGAGTLVASPNPLGGESIRVSRCTSAPPWLATAGSGDVLAGIIGGLLAQRMPAFEAASCGVWLHGDAAKRCGPGLIAEDLDAGIRKAISALVLSRQ